MSIAIDTNVLVRILVQDPTAPDQCAAARRLVAGANAAGEPLLVSLCAPLETEWVLRTRYKVNRKAMTSAFIAMLEAPGIEFKHDATVEEALYLFDQFPTADFADCLLVARATHLGRSRFLTFDAGAARLPRGELLQYSARCLRHDRRLQLIRRGKDQTERLCAGVAEGGHPSRSV